MYDVPPKKFETFKAQKVGLSSCSILENLFAQCPCLESLWILCKFWPFFFSLLRVMPEMRHKLSQQRWNMADETHHHHHHHFVWIRCHQPYLFLVKEKKEKKKKDRRLCVLMVVVLGDDIPFRQQQWSLSSRRDYQRSDLSCSFQCVYILWCERGGRRPAHLLVGHRWRMKIHIE